MKLFKERDKNKDVGDRAMRRVSMKVCDLRDLTDDC